MGGGAPGSLGVRGVRPAGAAAEARPSTPAPMRDGRRPIAPSPVQGGMRVTLALLTVLVLFSGCAEVGKLAAAAVDPPRLRFRSVEVRSVDL